MKIDHNISQELAQQAIINSEIAGGIAASQMEVKEEPQGVTITLKIPSLNEDNYHLELNNQGLVLYTLYGISEEEDALESSQRPAEVKVFPTPPNIDRDEIEAVFEGSKLQIFLPFKSGDEEENREIPIRSRYI